MFLGAVAGPLDLGVKPPRERLREPAERSLGRVHPAADERPRDGTFRAARQAVKALRMLRDELPRRARSSLLAPRRRRRQEPAEISVPGAIFDEERDA
jgi:hypothetical protein